MTTISYVFLDRDRDRLVPLAKQQEELDNYIRQQDMYCNEVLIEESCEETTPFRLRKEGKRLLENIGPGDVIFTLHARWVLGSPAEALSLIQLLKERNASLYCVDLGGDVVNKAKRKLMINEGIAELVYTLCTAVNISASSKGHSGAIRAGKAKKKKDGKFLGGPVPFGYLLGEDGRLQKDMAQQKIIAEMQRLKEDRWSYRNIAKKVKEEQGIAFSHEGVRRILLKEVNKE